MGCGARPSRRMFASRESFPVSQFSNRCRRWCRQALKSWIVVFQCFSSTIRGDDQLDLHALRRRQLRFPERTPIYSMNFPSIRRAYRSGGTRGGQRARLRGDAGGGLHTRGRVPLSASRFRDGTPFADRGELAAHTGIGLTLPPVFCAHGGFGGAPPAPRQRRFLSDAEGFARLVEGCRRAMRALVGPSVGIAPHSLRRVFAQRRQHRGAT